MIFPARSRRDSRAKQCYVTAMPAPSQSDPTAAPPSAGSALPPASTDAPPPPDPTKLTPEEQMALYEKHLKENDWGHQPC